MCLWQVLIISQLLKIMVLFQKLVELAFNNNQLKESACYPGGFGGKTTSAPNWTIGVSCMHYGIGRNNQWDRGSCLFNIQKRDNN